MQSEKTNTPPISSADDLVEEIKNLLPKDFPGCCVVIISESDDNGETVAMMHGHTNPSTLSRVERAYSETMKRALRTLLNKL